MNDGLTLCYIIAGISMVINRLLGVRQCVAVRESKTA